MESERDRKRKKDKHQDDDDSRREKKSRKPRSRSPDDRRDRDSRRKRRHSRSKSPDIRLKQEKQNDAPPKVEDVKNKAPERKNKDDMLNTRTGGAYIPPARLRMMQAQITDKSSMAYQRLAWEALKKSIHGHINKINVGNIGIIIKELLRENIVRGRGLLSRSVIQAQAASPTFTNVYAALVAAINSRFPNIGELLLKRLVIQFKRGFKRNDKPICISSASFIAHLVNQRVAHEILALELLTLLVESPTDDSVEVAIAFLKECGQKLTEVSSKGVNAIFEMLRNILHEGQLDKRVQYMIEVMFQIWKDGFKDHPALIEELELVPEEEQFTHLLMLDDATDSQDILNVFKFDEKYEENEQKYKTLCKEILGSDAESGGEDGSESGSGSEESEDEAEEGEEKPMTIIDNTETNLIALRRTIYLTINSSLDFEECAHKLMKMQLKPGQEVELCHMFLDCCAEQRTYEKFYGLLAQRFCNINRIYISPFEEIFKDSYATAHRLDTNRLRNVSKFFAHLMFTDSISWEVLECVKLNEEDTTSSSRIYIKILFQELAEYMGLKKLNDRLKDQTLQGAFSGVFPRDNPKNTRFSINFFTSIGLGGLTDELREHLKQMPKNVPPAITEIKVASDSSSSSSESSSSSSSSDSSSDSDDEESSKKKEKSKKKKDKNPKTPEEEVEAPKDKDKGERWGHDGFYDTYGKDARRTESRPERDRDNFAVPRDPRDQRNDRLRDERRDRNEDDRRRDDDSRRREDDSDRRRDRRNDVETSRRRNAEEERPRDRRGEDDSRSNRRESDRTNERDAHEDRASQRRNIEEDRSRDRRDPEDSRSNRRESDREKEKEVYETSKRRNADEERSRERRDEDDSRSNRRESDRGNEKRSGRKNTDDVDSRPKRREIEKEDDRRADRRNVNADDSRSKRREIEKEDDRRTTDSRNGEDYHESSKRRDVQADRSKDRRNEDNSRSKRRGSDEKVTERRNKDDNDSRYKRRDVEREDDRSIDRRNGKDDSYSKRKEQDKEVRVDRLKDRSRTDIDAQSRREAGKESDRGRDKDKSRDDDRERKREKEMVDKKSRKNKTASSDSEENSRTKQKSIDTDSSSAEEEKPRKKNKKKKSKAKSDTESSSSESEEEIKAKKKKKKSKKSKHEKENSWDIKNKRSLDKKTKTTRVYEKDKVDTEEWDIEREESISEEVPSRYWDKQNFVEAK